MSSRHEAILQYMIANPTQKMSLVAAAFRVTPAWLSTIVHSDAFQDQLARRHDELFDVAVVQELGDKVTAAAHLTIDEYLEKVPTLSADQLISASDKLLGRLGYGSNKNGSTNFNIGEGAQVQINGAQVAPDVVERARNKIGATIEGKLNGKNNGSTEVGATDQPSAIQVEPPQIAAEAEGDSLRETGQCPFGGEIRPDFIHPEPVVQVPALRGQDEVLPD